MLFWSIVAVFIGAALSFVSKECLRLLWKVVKRLRHFVMCHAEDDTMTSQSDWSWVKKSAHFWMLYSELINRDVKRGIVPFVHHFDVQTKCLTFSSLKEDLKRTWKKEGLVISASLW